MPAELVLLLLAQLEDDELVDVHEERPGQVEVVHLEYDLVPVPSSEGFLEAIQVFHEVILDIGFVSERVEGLDEIMFFAELEE